MKKTEKTGVLLVVLGLLLSLTGCSALLRPKATYPGPTTAQLAIIRQAEQLPMRPVSWTSDRGDGIFVYDSEGRLIRHDFLEHDDVKEESSRLIEEYTYEPWENGTKLTVRTKKMWHTNGTGGQQEELKNYYVCFFDADGVCQRKEVYEVAYGQLYCRKKCTYSYDAVGRLSEVETEHTYKLQTEEEQYIERTCYVWDADGRLTQTRNDALGIRQICTYRRNAYGDVVNKEVERMEIDEDGNVIHAVSRPSGKIRMIPMTSPPSVQLYDLDYVWSYEDVDGRLSHRATYNTNGGVRGEMWYQYDADGKLTGVETKRMGLESFPQYFSFCPWMIEAEQHTLLRGRVTWAAVSTGINEK